MNYLEPLKISQVDFNKIVYPKSKKGNTKKLILIKYNEKSKLKNFVFQTPTLLNIFTPQFNGTYADIEVGLVGKENNQVNKFINFLNELENKIKSDAQIHAHNWFNLDKNNSTINFQKIIRESEDYSTGTIKLKIIKNNDFETMLQLNNNKRIGLNNIPEDSWCKIILECYGIWVNTENDFGIFFRPILISFIPKEKQVYNYKLLEDSDDENNIDIPDTEVNENIFMKIESKNKTLNDSTSQLEFNGILNESQKTSEILLPIFHQDNNNISTVNINFKNEDENDLDLSSSSDSEDNSNNKVMNITVEERDSIISSDSEEHIDDNDNNIITETSDN
jgi:hypothetical protein